MHSESLGERASWPLKIVVGLTLVFMYVPIVLIAVYAFSGEVGSFPPSGFTLKWFARAFERQDVRDAIGLSLEIATLAATTAVVFGTLAALAVHSYRFAGRSFANILFNLPIALPGIITGIALLSVFRLLAIEPGLITVAIGHSTFCIVLVFSNVTARLQRMPSNLVEASMDLGADGEQTFRRIVLPNLASAILAGGVLAFALSFDEIIVTTFTAGSQLTLPLWLLNQLSKPREAPITNAVAMLVIGITTIPIVFAWYLARGTHENEGASR